MQNSVTILFHILAIAAYLQTVLEKHNAQDFKIIEISQHLLNYYWPVYREAIPHSMPWEDPPPTYTSLEESDADTIYMTKHVYTYDTQSIFWHTFDTHVNYILIGISERVNIVRYYTYKEMYESPSYAWKKRNEL